MSTILNQTFKNIGSPKYNIGKLLILILLFQFIISQINSRIYIQYIDEILIITTLLCIVFKTLNTGKINTFNLVIISTILYFIFISIIFGNEKSLYKIFLQSLIHVKFFIIYIIFRKLYYIFGVHFFRSILFIFTIITIIGLALNIMVGESFNHFFSYQSFERFHSFRYGGFQLKPNDFSFAISLIYCYTLFKIGNKLTLLNYLSITTLATMMIWAGGSRYAFVILILTGFGLCWENKQMRIVLPFWLLPIITISLVAFYNVLLPVIDHTIDNIIVFQNVDDSLYIRGIILVNGFRLAVLNFPIGTGAATFGSVLSGESTIYYEMFTSKQMYFVDHWMGLYDSNMASILGEFGFIGVCITITALRYMITDINIIFHHNKYSKTYLSIILTFGFLSSLSFPFLYYTYYSVLFNLFIFLTPTIGMKINTHSNQHIMNEIGT